MSRVRILQFGLLLIVAPMFMYLLTMLWRSGEFRRLTAEFPQHCREIQGVVGSEDITIDKLTRTAFIAGFDDGQGRGGKIYAYSLDQPAAQPVSLTDSVSFEFRPKGISLIRSPGGDVFLFVVNRRKDESTVERFRWEGQDLIHENTFRNPIIHDANDVVAISPEQFYVSIEGRAAGPLGKFLESWLQLGRGYVAFFDGQTVQVAATGFSLTNGIQLSADGTQLLVAATASRTITVLNRSEDNRLHLDQVLDVDTGVDNLEVDLDGTVWVAAHPRLLSYLWYLRARGRRAPSEVFRIRIFEQTLFEKVPFFVDPEGDLLSASSVATFDSGTLLIGSVADTWFLDCRLGN